MNHALRANGLRVSITGRDILRGVDFALPKGAYLAIIGPNGSGKSTLIKCFLGLVEPSEGFIQVAEGQTVGYVPQIKTLDRSFPARACDLVASGVLGRWPWRIEPQLHDRVHEALESVGVGSLIGAPLAKLSGGELQRVYLARAIIREPDLLLLDEPATGIDFAGEEAIHRTVEQIQRKRNTTVAIVTHDISVALYHASHVLVLRSRQLAYGSPGEVLTDAVLREAFGHAGHEHAMQGAARERP